MAEKIDLFNTLVKYLAIKPLKFDQFDYDEAQNYIKEDKKGAITFIGDHGYFEQVLDAMVNQVAKSAIKTGTVYSYVKGQGCSDRFKRRLLELSMSVSNVIILGDPNNWPKMSGNIKFSQNYDIFADNHQRFFIFQSPSLNIALVARHEIHDGEEKIEAAITNDNGAVQLLAMTLGTRIYPLN